MGWVNAHWHAIEIPIRISEHSNPSLQSTARDQFSYTKFRHNHTRYAFMSSVIAFEGRQPEKLSRYEFQAIVRACAASGKIGFSRHARLGHPERHITPSMVMRCLLKGTVEGDPYLQFGDWKAEIYRHGAGEALTVVVALQWEKRALVVTAF